MAGVAQGPKNKPKQLIAQVVCEDKKQKLQGKTPPCLAKGYCPRGGSKNIKGGK